MYPGNSPMERFSKPGAGQLEIKIWSPACRWMQSQDKDSSVLWAHIQEEAAWKAQLIFAQKTRAKEVIFKKIRDAFNPINKNRRSQSVHLSYPILLSDEH